MKTAVTRYLAQNGAIIGHNLPHFNNRPLYCDNTTAIILTGDRPLARFGQERHLYGTFMAALIRNGTGKWLHDCVEVVSAYQAGGMTWTVRDPAFAGTTATVEVVPMVGAVGMAIRANVENAQPGDRLLWSFGGAELVRGGRDNIAWDYDAAARPEVLTYRFDPKSCLDNIVTLDGSAIRLKSPAQEAPVVVGACGTRSAMALADAAHWTEPAELARHPAGESPLACGEITPGEGLEVFWAFEAATALSQSPADAFAAGKHRVRALAARVSVNTPDPRLDALASAAVAAVDGAWIAPGFYHGTMSWKQPFPGWRTIFGGSAFGWHERVREQAAFYIGMQVRESDKTEAKANPDRLLATQHADSRLYGRGHIPHEKDAIHIMQSQFFDQIVHDWRWTADPELEALLRPALDLHLEWQRECFDPDGDGCYESYINTFPTDSMWFNGGGGVEETIYAWRGHEAARDMARRARDEAGVRHHEEMLDRIRRGFFEKLWIPRKGHAGLYREQGGHQRLLENAWLYSIFMPVDSALLTVRQAAQSLYYSRWGLQNDAMPAGGRTVWNSNLAPGIWSVRDNWPGDNYHLALAYFRAGLAADGWDVFRGTWLDTAFNQQVPGNVGSNLWIDFGDCAHMFARTLVEGLFGLQPDYPNGVVLCAPQFPAGWEHASIRTPDAELSFKRQQIDRGQAVTTLEVKLARAAKMELRVPVRTTRVHSVTVNGDSAPAEVLPGFGCSIVRTRVAKSDAATLRIVAADVLPEEAPVRMETTVGAEIAFRANGAPILEIENPQFTMRDMRIERGVASGIAGDNVGHHTLIAKVDAGETPQWRLFHLHITNPKAEATEAGRYVREIPDGSRWECLDLSAVLNADARQIYRQKYLSPRPNTVSARIDADGYSPWTFTYWQSPPPEIQLDGIPALLDAERRIKTPQGVPFVWPNGERNIAFTSLWDNFPRRITVPAGRVADAIWFLVCGSTTVMQVRIANAALALRYADGGVESLELIPPFNFWNLSPIGENTPLPHHFPVRTSYTEPADAFAVPKPWPETVQLGRNCRAILLNRRLRPGVKLESIELETLSQEVVIGLMGVTLMNPIVP